MKYTQLLATVVAAALFISLPAAAQKSHRAVADSSFVTKAAEGGAAEVQMGQLAQSKATNQAVKDLASRLVTDHTKANDELKPIATKENVTWPTGMDAKAQAEYNKLQGLSGAEFDREYVNYQIKDHKQDIALFQHEADHGTDTGVKSWAAQTLPTLQEHLRMAENAQKSLH